MKIAAIAMLALAGFSANVLATDDNFRTISSVGAAGAHAYVTFNEGTSQPCQFSIVYFPDADQPMGKAMLAIALSAQARNAPLMSVSYSMDASGQCTATAIRQ